MIPVLIPIGASLAVAILTDLMGSTDEEKYRKSLEVCTASCRAIWLKEDGVLKVYHSTSETTCAQIVVEVMGAPPVDLPGNIEGHPVRIKIHPPGSDFGATEEDAAEKFLAMAQAHNRHIIEKDGQKVWKDELGRSQIVLAGGPLTEREASYLNYVGEKFNVEPSVNTSPTGSEMRLHISFNKR